MKLKSVHVKNKLSKKNARLRTRKKRRSKDSVTSRRELLIDNLRSMPSVRREPSKKVSVLPVPRKSLRPRREPVKAEN